MMQNSPNSKRKTKMNEMKHFNRLVNPLTVTHCFSPMSQSMSLKWKFTFKNRYKISTGFVFMLPEM